MDLFISCDWGTSNGRWRVVDRTTRRVLAEEKSESGVAVIYQQWQQASGEEATRLSFYQSILLEQIRALSSHSGIATDGLLLIISGMASSSLGMMELPYKELPLDVAGRSPSDGAGKGLVTIVMPATDLFNHDLLLVSGVRTDEDVMRGEETQLIGCLADRRETRGLYIFPGTHSKHVRVEDGLLAGFTTYMTGEFFHLLSQKSILAASVTISSFSSGNDNQQIENNYRQSFEKGIEDSQRTGLLHSPFLVRTNSLFGRWSKEENYHYLSGLLIGEELKEIAKAPMPVTIVGGGSQREYYRLACELLHVPLTALMDADEALIRGHLQLFDQYRQGLIVPSTRH
jgi:2-dehydro-3-deoxygalactonokinase